MVRLWKIVVALTAALAVAGCGDDQVSSGPDSAVVEDTTTARDTTSSNDGESESSEEDWSSVEAAAREEGRLVIYSTQGGDNLDRVREEFGLLYPEIEVEVARVISNDLYQRFAVERDAGQKLVDVIEPGFSHPVEDWCEEGSVVELPDLPSLETHDWPSSHLVSDCGIVGFRSPWLLWYNTDLVSPDEVPKTWEDLLSPRWSGGKIAALDPSRGDSFLWVYVVASDGNGGDEYLRAFREQEPKWMEANGKVVQELATGAAEIGVLGSATVGTPLKNDGAPIESIVLDPLIGSELTSAIAEGAPHPNAAALYLNWLASPAGQSVIAGEVHASSALQNIPGALDLPDDVTWAPLDPSRASVNSEEGLRIRDLLDRP